jgi:hypothetical protein
MYKNEYNEWVIDTPSQLDNFILGNILSYQNNDVSFLTFRNLIYPSNEDSLKTSSSGVSDLFSDTTTDTSFSSPEIPVPLGDTAKYNGKISENDTNKADICISVLSTNYSEDTGFAVTVKIQNNNEDQLETLIPSDCFRLYKNGSVSECVVGEDLVVSYEPQTFTLKFSGQTDIIAFVTADSTMYFSVSD